MTYHLAEREGVRWLEWREGDGLTDHTRIHDRQRLGIRVHRARAA